MRASDPAITLRSLLANEALHLEVVHVPEHTLDNGIRWVTVTELVDPAPYLLGDELILTLGSSWPDPESPDIERFVERISSAGVTAVGISPEMYHDGIPQRMIDAASQYGLPLLHVPLRTSFRSIGEFVVEQTVGDRYRLVQRTLATHIDLTEALTSRLGMEGLLTRLRMVIGSACAVVDIHGNLIASRPYGGEWPTEEISRTRSTAQWGSQIGDVALYPVTVADQRVAFLCTETGTDEPEIMRFAVALVGLELARRQAEQHGRRELLGQIISDYVQGDLADHEAFRRLSRAGVQLDGQNRVVLARVDAPASKLTDVPWSSDTFAPGHVGEYVVALVDGLVAAIVPERVPIDLLVAGMREQLGRIGRVSVGIGSPYPGAPGLRLSWLEAQEGIRAGGIGTRVSLSLSRLMLANMRVPLNHVGEEILRPLIDYDEEHSGDLVKTLQVFIEHDGQTSEAAAALYIHRNTMRYRLQLIERLTSRDLSSFGDLVNFYLALQAYDGESFGAR